MHVPSKFPLQRFVVWILVAVLAGYVPGCAPAATALPTVAPTAIPSVAPSVAPTTAPTAAPTPIPTLTPTSFVPKATIKIFVHVPMSGQFAEIGTDIERAVTMAVQELAAPLNDLGYEVRLVSYDDKTDMQIAVQNAKEIIADPEVLCGVGNLLSRITIQASEVYHSGGLAAISPSSTVTTVTDRGYAEVSRLLGREDVHGVAAAQFVKSKGFSSIYIIQPPGDISAKNADYFKREADRSGVKVVGMLRLEQTEDYSGVVSRVLNLNPDLVYFAGLAGQAGPFFRQARGAGYMGTFLVIDSDPALADLAGPLLTEGGGAYYVDTIAPASAYPGAASFVQDFDNRYGAAPHNFAAQAYDAAGLCLRAIESAATAKGGELPTRAEVAKALRALTDYPGITGTYSFDKRGDPTQASYFIYKVVGVDAASWTQNELVATLQLPPLK